MTNLIVLGNHHAPESAASPSSERLSLTAREIQCVELAYLSNADIGLALGIAKDTVRANLRTAFLKLNVSSRAEAYRVWERGMRKAA